MKNKIIVFCIFLGVIIIFSSVIFVYSKYNKGFGIETFTEIAEPIFEIVNEEVNIIDALNENKYFYEFKIRNYKGNTVTEIAFEYDIRFIFSQENAPILLKLYRIDKENKIELELENNRLIKKEEFQEGKDEKCYLVEVIYDKNSKVILKNDFEIKLSVEAMQQEEMKI